MRQHLPLGHQCNRHHFSSLVAKAPHAKLVGRSSRGGLPLAAADRIQREMDIAVEHGGLSSIASAMFFASQSARVGLPTLKCALRGQEEREMTAQHGFHSPIAAQKFCGFRLLAMHLSVA